MSAERLLILAKTIIERELCNLILDLKIDVEDPRIAIKLMNGNRLYVQFNDHDQYGYSLVFSDGKLDRARFDNYDDRWSVSTRPHHFHPRLNMNAFESVMTGNPYNRFSVHFIRLTIKKTSCG